MGKAIPSQHHPAVVLRSHAKAVRALLAVAIIAVVGFTAALVIVADDDDTGTTSASPTGQVNYGGFNPATGRPDSAPRGAEEGTRGIQQSDAAPAAPVYVNPSTGYASPAKTPGPQEGTTGPSR